MRRFVLEAAFLAAFLFASPAAVAVCRVTASGAPTGSGATWTDATTLQAALGNPACREVWVAAGRYVPTVGADRGVAFVVRPGVQLYGGFAGTEDAREQRDPSVHRSVLSGDIDGNDATDADGATLDADDIAGANSHHVVVMDGTTAYGPIGADTVLDGFTISGGQAHGAYPASSGAGLYCNGNGRNARCDPTLADLRFTGNSAAHYGGALFALADTTGGGASPVLRDVAFSGNRANLWGGAIYVKANVGCDASPRIERATFTRNRADQGGAIYNRAGGQGGTAHMAVVNATFHANDASLGAAYSGNGGAIYNEGVGGDAHVTLRNVTFSDNTALGLNHFGGALVNSGTRARMLVAGSILWGNRATDRPQIYRKAGEVQLRDSVVEGGCPVDVACERVVDGDPRLAPLSDDGGGTPTQLPARSGAAFEAGEDDGCPATDQRGVARPQGERCDAGAVEIEVRRCHVDHAATGAGTGATWADACVDLQSALRAADCGEVWVAQGLYKPVRPADPDAVTEAERLASFDIAPATRVYGGFAGHETSRDERDPVANPTVLSGDIDGNDLVDAEGVVAHADDVVGANSYHVVRMDGTTPRGPITAATRLDGFVVTAGNANSGGGMQNTGGGLLCDGDGAGGTCSPALSRLRFSGNCAGWGGAVAVTARNQGIARPSFTDVVFRANAASRGGAMCNDAYGAGGTAEPLLRDVGFIGNRAVEGGALCNLSGYDGARAGPRLANVDFLGNGATRGGAIASWALHSAVATLELRHVTLAGNQAEEGAAIWNDASWGATVSASLANAIVWGNVGLPIRNGEGATSTIHASLLEGGCRPGDGNDCSGVVDADPRLGPLADNGGFVPSRLPDAGSAAVDAADAEFCLDADQRGVARPQGRGCDLGAVEVRSARLEVRVGTAEGRISLQSPQALAGALAGCSQADASACSASLSREHGDPDVVLATAPATHYLSSLASDCGAVHAPTQARIEIAALAADCTLQAGFAPNLVRGNVRNLSGDGLVLHLDAGDGGPGESLAVAVGGDAFAFDTPVAAGRSWTVTVAAAPERQACSVAGGAGTMAPGGYDAVDVACVDTHAIHVVARGVDRPGLVVQLNGAHDLAIDGDGVFAFAPRLASGATYAVSILASPPDRLCGIPSGATGVVADADVEVGVSCEGLPALALTLDDGRDFARYGHFVDFVATLSNDGGTARGVAVTFVPSAGYDAAYAQWSCHGAGAGANCEQDADDPRRFVVTLPPGRRLAWTVRIPVHGQAEGDTVALAIEADGAGVLRDVNTLVLFKDGLDVPYGGGARPASADASTATASSSLAPAGTSRARSEPPGR